MQFIRTEGECVPALPQDRDRGQCLSFQVGMKQRTETREESLTDKQGCERWKTVN